MRYPLDWPLDYPRYNMTREEKLKEEATERLNAYGIKMAEHEKTIRDKDRQLHEYDQALVQMKKQYARLQAKGKKLEETLASMPHFVRIFKPPNPKRKKK